MEGQVMDMSTTIAPKSDQLNADDLISGPRTITVTRVSGNDNADQPVNIYFQGDNGKPFRPCKSMRRVLVHCWGPDATKYAGRSMTIYRDPKVTFGGMQVGGIRISHMSHIERAQTMALTATRAKRAPYKVEVLQGMETPPPAEPKPADPAHLEAARGAAAEGTDAFRAWWTANPDMRDSAKSIMPELQEKCAQVDAAKAPPDDDEELPM